MEENHSRDFRVYLQQELIRRTKNNPLYSLRAFAKSLNIHHATLSHLMRGKRQITEKTKKKLMIALNLTPEEQDFFNSDQELENSFGQIDLDTFAMISDWYHDAILELTRVRGFKSEIKWVSQVLGISIVKTQAAVERLERLGLLKISKNKKWVETESNISGVDNHQKRACLMKLQGQLLDKAKEALNEYPLHLRSQSSMAMAIHTSDLPKAEEMIKNFRRKLCKFLQRPEKMPNQVYQLSVSLFPLSKV